MILDTATASKTKVTRSVANVLCELGLRHQRSVTLDSPTIFEQEWWINHLTICSRCTKTWPGPGERAPTGAAAVALTYLASSECARTIYKAHKWLWCQEKTIIQSRTLSFYVTMEHAVPKPRVVFPPLSPTGCQSAIAPGALASPTFLESSAEVMSCIVSVGTI